MSDFNLIKEGKIKKGGVGTKPVKNRPLPPKGQNNNVTKENA